MIQVTGDVWQLTHDRWTMTGDTCYDRWHNVLGEHFLKMSASFGSPYHTHDRCPHFHVFSVPDLSQLLQRFTFLCSSKLDLEDNVKPHSAHWLCNLSAALLWLCIHSRHILKLFLFPWSLLILNHLDRESLQIGVHQHCNHFVHPVDLLLHSSVMLYSFVRSSLDTTHVTLELRSLIWWPFSHFIWYICMFSLTTFIWFFAWIAILVIWLQNRLIRLCHSTFPTTLLME